MDYWLLTEEELSKEYESARRELARAEYEWHDAAVSYGNGCGSMVDSAHSWFQNALERVQALEEEMRRRGMEFEAY